MWGTIRSITTITNNDKIGIESLEERNGKLDVTNFQGNSHVTNLVVVGKHLKNIAF